MSADDDVMFRPMVEADIPAGLELCRASHWNQVERDWRRFLTWDPRCAVVAVRDGRVIGTVVTVRYAEHRAPGMVMGTHDGPVAALRESRGGACRFAWVAMMLVDPGERGRGVGRALLTRGLALLDDVETVRLDATPAGEPLYRTLGFVEESRLTRLQRAAGAGAPPSAVDALGLRVRPIQTSDWDAIAALDARVFAADRRAMLEWLSEGAPEYAWVATAPTEPRIVGYVFGRRGYNFDHIGPVIADDTDTAARLVRACLTANARRDRDPDRACILDVPVEQTAWRRWLTEAGFVEQRPFLRMSRGRAAPAGEPSILFASLGPEFG